LRDKTHVLLGADPHDGSDFFRVRRFEQKWRPAHEAVAPFYEVWCKLVGIDGVPGWANEGFQPF
jgi:hypothetical protein